MRRRLTVEVWLAATATSILLLGACDRLGGGESEHDEHEGEHDEHEGEHDEHEGEEGVVELSSEAQQRLGIELATSNAGRLNDLPSIAAEVEFDPLRVAHVTSLVPGRLSDVHVQLGDQVSRDQPLAEIQSLELGLVRAEYQEARAIRDVAQSQYDRQESLNDEGISSVRELINAEGQLRASEARLRAASTTLEVYEVGRRGGSAMTIESPMTGIIVAQHATPGEAVNTVRSLFVVADLSRVWVVGQVYEQDLRLVSVGVPVVVSLRAYPGRMWNGEIDFIAPTLDHEQRTMAVRVVLDNSDGILRPGMFGQLALQVDETAADVALVAFEAIQEVEERSVVFVPGEHPGEFELRDVVVGRVADGIAEVLAGLAPGETYVAFGAFALKSAQLASELGHGHAH